MYIIASPYFPRPFTFTPQRNSPAWKVRLSHFPTILSSYINLCLTESTPLSCSLADQGIKIRIRKDIRVRKRPMPVLDPPHPIPLSSAPLPTPSSSNGSSGSQPTILPSPSNGGTVFPSMSAPPVRLDGPPPVSIPPLPRNGCVSFEQWSSD